MSSKGMVLCVQVRGMESVVLAVVASGGLRSSTRIFRDGRMLRKGGGI